MSRLKTFLAERTAIGVRNTDFLYLGVLHREFVRWSRVKARRHVPLEDVVAGKLYDGEPTSSQIASQMKAMGYEPQAVERDGRRDVYYRLALLDVVRQPYERQRAEHQEPVVIEQLRARNVVMFRDGEIKKDELVDRMRPSAYEQRELDRSFENDKTVHGDQARVWLVVQWRGKRRYVSSLSFARLERPSNSS